MNPHPANSPVRPPLPFIAALLSFGLTLVYGTLANSPNDLFILLGMGVLSLVFFCQLLVR